MSEQALFSYWVGIISSSSAAAVRDYFQNDTKIFASMFYYLPKLEHSWKNHPFFSFSSSTSSIQVKVMSVAPAECYLTQYMACFKQLGHFELLRDRMLYHFSETAQQQRASGEMSEDDFQEERAAV